MRFHMKNGSEDNDIVAATATPTATAEHIRKFVFSGGSAGGERLEIKIPEVGVSYFYARKVT